MNRRLRRYGRSIWRYLVPAVCTVLLIVGLIASRQLPQRPDGDRTAVRQYTTLVRSRPLAAQLGLLDVRHQFWYTLAGALLAVWLLDQLLQEWPATAPPWHADGKLILYLGGLLWLAGWGWTQTTGWQGELFLPPDHPVGLGPAQHPTVRYDTFLIRPAPAGAGRSLTMRVHVNGRPAMVSVDDPLHTDGWTIRPRWYGGLVRLSNDTRLYFGGDGTQQATVGDQTVEVTLDVETLEVRTSPPVEAEATWYAIVTARFDPGAPVRRLGILVLVVGLGLWAWRWWHTYEDIE